MKQGIFRRIFLLYATILALAVLVIELFVTGTVRGNYVNTLRDHLAAQTALIADAVPFASNAPLDAAAGRWKEITRARVTIVSTDGRVIGDSDQASSRMENHAGRPEIQQAGLYGTGTAVRHSDTVNYDALYVARRVARGGAPAGYIRLSVPLGDVDASVNALRMKIIVVVSIVLLATGLFSLFQFDRLRRLTNQIRGFAASAAAGEIGKRPFLAQAGEFQEIADSLNAMALSLQGRVKSLDDEMAKLETALFGISDGVMLLNQAGRVVLANRAVRELMGIQGDVHARPFMEIIRHHGLSEIIREAHERRVPSSGEVEMEVPRRLVLAVTALPIIQESMREDTFRGTVVALHDITRLKALERVRKDFVANVSHELKTPIAAIRGFAETLLDGALDKRVDAEKFIGIIYNHSARLQRLVEDLLTLSRIELGETRFLMKQVDVRQPLENALALIQPQADARRIALGLEIGPDLPPVAADHDRITQVLVNLLDNAVKFTPEGGSVRVRAQMISRDEGGRTKDETTSLIPASEASGRPSSVEISVEDTGPGIPPLLIPRLGERFFRVDASRSRELGGTGLGLAIVKHILQAHGSSLVIRNAPRRGTIVSFCLPVMEQAARS